MECNFYLGLVQSDTCPNSFLVPLYIIEWQFIYLFIYLFLSPTVNTKLKTFPCVYVTAVKAFCNSGVSLKFSAGQHLVYMEDKVRIWANVANQAGGYPGFCSIKWLGVFLLPPGWDASPLQGYPQH